MIRTPLWRGPNQTPNLISDGYSTYKHALILAVHEPVDEHGFQSSARALLR